MKNPKPHNTHNFGIHIDENTLQRAFTLTSDPLFDDTECEDVEQNVQSQNSNFEDGSLFDPMFD